MSAILTIAEAAERMSVSRQRMHKLIETYNLETSKVNGRLIVLHEGELKKIDKQRKIISAEKASAAKLDRMIATKTETTTESVLRHVISAIAIACEQGDNVSAIAQRAGVPRSMVSGLRNGNYPSSPTLDKLEAICSAVGLRLTTAPK